MYARGSQARHWSFTPQQVAALRARTCAGEADVAECERQPPPPPQQQRLTAGEERAVATFFQRKLEEVARVLGFPEKPEFTAGTYFKRFFLLNSVARFAPKLVMLASLSLAAKVEEYHVDVPAMCARFKCDSREVAGFELTLMARIKFHLHIYHPHVAALGFLTDWWQRSPPQQKGTVRQEEVLRETVQQLRVLFRTDAPLVFPPGQLAVCALQRVFSTSSNASITALKPEFESYLQQRLSAEENERLADAVTALLPYLDEGAHVPSNEELARISPRLKLAQAAYGCMPIKSPSPVSPPMLRSPSPPPAKTPLKSPPPLSPPGTLSPPPPPGTLSPPPPPLPQSPPGTMSPPPITSPSSPLVAT
eukprot:TRINITY_DN11467_c0_g1_i4.p1 TRINITY_DN11467_c0_g1~~TRINITY_DN11467_c0_g1_i4.p1  ORF type:complete len:364 (+),score=140.80 TRINITY_DN11467_c0_g1_i4:2-1093(+)